MKIQRTSLETILKSNSIQRILLKTRGMSPPPSTSNTPKWTTHKVERFPDRWEYTPDDFKRGDETPDTQFYSSSRFVTHIDGHAIEKLTQYYSTLIPDNGPCTILDLCGSWISHLVLPLPSETKVVGIGLNEEELKANPAYTIWKVHDLNASEDQNWTWLETETINTVICTVSIDYLIHPISVLKECFRVLKPGGTIHLAISNRCFATKAIALWLRLGENARLEMVANYLHFSGFEEIEVVDIAKGGDVGRWEGDWGLSDPLWVVRGRKM